MPFPLAAIGLGLGGAGAIGNLFEGRKARKDAKRAAEEQRKENAEKRKLDAMINLISVAGGGGPQGFSQAQVPGPAPQIGVGDSLSQLGQLTNQFGLQGEARDLRQSGEARAEDTFQYGKNQRAVLEKRAAESAEAEKKYWTDRANWYARRSAGNQDGDDAYGSYKRK